MGVMLWVSSLVEGVPVLVVMVMGVVLAGARADPLPPPASGEHSEKVRHLRMRVLCELNRCGDVSVVRISGM